MSKVTTIRVRANSKFTEDDIRTIRTDCKTQSVTEIARRWCVPPATITAIKSRHTWKTVE
jgi:hypothetical protein